MLPQRRLLVIISVVIFISNGVFASQCLRHEYRRKLCEPTCAGTKICVEEVACVCKKPYVRDTEIGICVLKKKCTHRPLMSIVFTDMISAMYGVYKVCSSMIQVSTPGYIGAIFPILRILYLIALQMYYFIYNLF